MSKRLMASLIAIISLSAGGTASATGFIEDDAALFSRDTVAQVSRQIDQNYKKTGKVIHVHTVTGQIDDTRGQAQTEYRRLHVNGVEIYIAPQVREDREIISSTLPSNLGQNIHQVILSAMKAKNPDKALTDAVEISIAGIDGTTAETDTTVTPVRKEQTIPTQTVVATPVVKAAEEHHGNPLGWILVLLSLGGIGFALYAWRKNEEKKLRKPSTENALNTTKDMMEDKSEAAISSRMFAGETSTRLNLTPPVASVNQNTSVPPQNTYPSGPAPYYPPQPQTVIVNHDSGMDMMTGVMIGGMMSGGHHDHTEVIHDTQIIHDQAPAPTPAPSAPAESPRESGGSWNDTSSKTTESGGSWGSNPSSSSYDSSPSSSGGGWGDSESSSSDSSGDSSGGW